MALNELNTSILNVGPRKYYLCSKCGTNRACVIVVNSNLICVKCRYDEIGVEALKEPLFWDL